MKKLTKWFIATFAGMSILFSSCVDQIKFGDSFLEKLIMRVHSCGKHIVNYIMDLLRTGMMWTVR